MFAMAGIWNETKKEEGCVRSFSVLTSPASPNILHIHHRMPVIINPQDWSDWLDNDSQLDHLLSYYSQPKETLNFHQVASKVNHVKNDGPDLTVRFTEKQSTLW
jgi:putative SOS response-associated peptidase YedK